jgi:hypothetical protein
MGLSDRASELKRQKEEKEEKEEKRVLRQAISRRVSYRRHHRQRR